VRDEEKTATWRQGQAERHKNFSWLEEQQATLNQQVSPFKSTSYAPLRHLTLSEASYELVLQREGERGKGTWSNITPQKLKGRRFQRRKWNVLKVAFGRVLVFVLFIDFKHEIECA